MTTTHIAQADIASLKVGDHVEQAGVIYRVTDIVGITNGIGFQPHAVYYLWTGSEASDIFRSVVNSRKAIGQIRWEAPHGMAVWFNGKQVAA